MDSQVAEVGINEWSGTTFSLTKHAASANHRQPAHDHVTRCTCASAPGNPLFFYLQIQNMTEVNINNCNGNYATVVEFCSYNKCKSFSVSYCLIDTFQIQQLLTVKPSSSSNTLMMKLVSMYVIIMSFMC